MFRHTFSSNILQYLFNRIVYSLIYSWFAWRSNRRGHMLNISSTGTYLFLSDGINSYSYKNWLGSYNLIATYNILESVSASGDLTYMWRGMAGVGHMVICNSNNLCKITYDLFQPLYIQLSVAADVLTILAYGQATMTMDYYYTCTNFLNCASCNLIVRLSCTFPYT